MTVGNPRRALLQIDPAVVGRARRLAERAAEPVIELARTHTTTSVERAVLRLAGLAGAMAIGGVVWLFGAKYLEEDTRLAPTRVN